MKLQGTFKSTSWQDVFAPHELFTGSKLYSDRGTGQNRTQITRE